MHVHIHTTKHTYTLHTYMQQHTHNACIHTNASMHRYIYTCTHLHTHMYTKTCMHVCMCMHMHAHTHSLTCTHTYTQSYHVAKQGKLPPGPWTYLFLIPNAPIHPYGKLLCINIRYCRAQQVSKKLSWNKVNFFYVAVDIICHNRVTLLPQYTHCCFVVLTDVCQCLFISHTSWKWLLK